MFRPVKTRGCVARAALLAMVFKLTKVAEQSWRTLKGHARLGQVDPGREVQRRITTTRDSKNRRLITSHTQHLQITLYQTQTSYPGSLISSRHRADNDQNRKREKNQAQQSKKPWAGITIYP